MSLACNLSSRSTDDPRRSDLECRIEPRCFARSNLCKCDKEGKECKGLDENIRLPRQSCKDVRNRADPQVPICARDTLRLFVDPQGSHFRKLRPPRLFPPENPTMNDLQRLEDAWSTTFSSCNSSPKSLRVVLHRSAEDTRMNQSQKMRSRYAFLLDFHSRLPLNFDRCRRL